MKNQVTNITNRPLLLPSSPKNSLLTLLLLILGISANGQQLICGNSVSVNGQEYFYKIDGLPDQYDLGFKGDDNLWLFTSLKGPRSLKYETLSAKQGRFTNHFPDAELVVRSPDGKETYLQEFNGSWKQVGYARLEVNSIEPLVVAFNQPLNSCTPQDINLTTRYATTISGSLIGNLTFDDVKDASGVLYLPDGIFDVTRTTRKMTRVFNGVAQESFEYYFEDNATGTIVMLITMNQDNSIDKIRYLTNEDEYAIRGVSNTREFLLYPNTGYGEVRLEFTNFSPGTYSLVVYDIVGRELWRKQFEIISDVTVKEDLSFLPRGTYPYTIIDENQNRILTRRLAIIKS